MRSCEENIAGLAGNSASQAAEGDEQMEQSPRDNGMAFGHPEADPAGGGSGAARLLASGELTVGRIAEFRLRLLQSLATAEWTVVDCSALSGADVSFFQLLCSAHRTASAGNRKLTLTGHDSELFIGATVKIGLRRHVGCALDALQSCLWKGECNNG